MVVVGVLGMMKRKEQRRTVMIVEKIGRYKLLQNYKIHQSGVIHNLPAGMYIKIIQIDKKYQKVLLKIATVSDWVNWDMPVEPVTEDSNG